MQAVCIVVPCYNESTRLQLGEFECFLKDHAGVDFLFVNDGSKDDTVTLIRSFSTKHPERVFFFNKETNQGKAEAVRSGVHHAGSLDKKYGFVGFWDADLATPLAEIPSFVSDAEKYHKQIVIGSRMKRLGATISRKRKRHLLGRVFSTFASIILKLPVYDTQCGAKIFSTEVLSIFNDEFITKWLFDIELLARYRNSYGMSAVMNNIVERPVTVWVEKGGSKLGLSYMLKVPFELFKIHRKYNNLS